MRRMAQLAVRVGLAVVAAWLVAPRVLRGVGFHNRHVLFPGVDGCRSDALQAPDASNL